MTIYKWDKQTLEWMRREIARTRDFYSQLNNFMNHYEEEQGWDDDESDMD